MLGAVHSIVVYLCYVGLLLCFPSNADEESRAWEFVQEQSRILQEVKSKAYKMSWNYFTNITDHNERLMGEENGFLSKMEKMAAKGARQFDLSRISNSTLLRMLKKLMDVGYVDDRHLMDKLSRIQAKMIEIYSSAEWCRTKNDCMPMYPDLEESMAITKDYNELLDMWIGWREVSGNKLRDLYQDFANLTNIAVQAAGEFEDRGAYLRSWYESPTFEEDVRQLFVELRPLYDQLHAYVRGKLKKYYSEYDFPTSGHVPAHIFGNMWAQSWTNIYDILAPFPDRELQSLTDKMIQQDYNVSHMYRLAHDFYTSLGFDPLPASFWEKSMLVKPEDGRKVVCHASAWDMYTGNDFRIKQCTTVTGDQLMTVHHEVGHLFYYSAYAKQPFLFRNGANPGFHEAMADIALLSFHAPKYLHQIGLLENIPNSEEDDINLLFKTAIDRVAFLPFGYLIDQWRWNVYRGVITPENYNKEWWKLRCYYQGVAPPVVRTEEMFDPGAKYHIPGDYPYIRYFVSYVTQFQWHKALCEVSGHQGPLHRCSIFKNRAAGERLGSMLRMGSSRPWSEAMRVLTRGTSGETDKLSTRALLDYFKPLQEWLTKENIRTGQVVGWDRTVCPNVDENRVSSSNRLAMNICLAVVFILTQFI